MLASNNDSAFLNQDLYAFLPQDEIETDDEVEIETDDEVEIDTNDIEKITELLVESITEEIRTLVGEEKITKKKADEIKNLIIAQVKEAKTIMKKNIEEITKRTKESIELIKKPTQEGKATDNSIKKIIDRAERFILKTNNKYCFLLNKIDNKTDNLLKKIDRIADGSLQELKQEVNFTNLFKQFPAAMEEIDDDKKMKKLNERKLRKLKKNLIPKISQHEDLIRHLLKLNIIEDVELLIIWILCYTLDFMHKAREKDIKITDIMSEAVKQTS